MSILIQLQNLPWPANSMDIRRFFSGLSIPEDGVHVVGGEMGDAFIAFSTDEDARLAMAKDGGKIKDMQIKLLLSSPTEMMRVIEQARQQNMIATQPQIVAPQTAILSMQPPARIMTPTSEPERKRGHSNPECIASVNPHKKIKYNKNNIEKILYESTNKNLEVFLSYPNKQEPGNTHYSATDKLIKRIQLYLSEEKKNVQHFLVLYLNTEELVDIAYLGHLYYSDMHQYWKLDIVPLVNYKHIRVQIQLYLERNLHEIDVNIPGARIHNNLNIFRKPVEHVIEYAKLRMRYLKLGYINFEQYKVEFDSIELSKSSISEAHKKILEQSSNDNNE